MTSSLSEQVQFTGVEPRRAHETDAGFDLFAVAHIDIEPGERALIPTATYVAIPTRHVGLIKDRSSMAVRGAHVLAGVIDEGYRGEVKVLILNVGDKTIEIDAGDKIAQMLIMPVAYPDMVRVKTLPPADRGSAGFGSTGR